MQNNNDKIKNLESKINTLNDYLKYCAQEINGLKQELNQLKTNTTALPIVPIETKKQEPIVEVDIERQIIQTETTSFTKPIIPQQVQQAEQKISVPAKKFNLEEYIGSNLIAKIGIVILVIGVAFGVKYAVDANLINPLTRIVLAFVLGGGLLFTALKLKNKYELFSAILLSGAMATLYITTYAGFAWYNLYPGGVAFALMLIFTSFTVFSATMYNNQWIALFGLVGAYCIPFLTSNNSGNIVLFFSYVAIINIGILIISFKKNWVWLNLSAFVLTIAIFISWFSNRYNQTHYVAVASIFSTLNFVVFYISFLAYKIIKNETFSWRSILVIVVNNLFYFLIGIILVTPISNGDFKGLFAITNALIHFGVGYFLFRKASVDKSIFYLLLSFAIAFFTIAIPLQLNGVWVTLFLSAELILLAYIGFLKQINLYKWFAFAVAFLALFSLLNDFSLAYSYPYSAPLNNVSQIPFFNLTFLSSIFYLFAISILLRYLFKEKQLAKNSFVGTAVMFYTLIPLVIVMSFTIFFIEIADKFYVWNAQSAIKKVLNIGFGQTTFEYQYDYSINYFKNIWLVNYSFLFAFIFSILVIKKIKTPIFIYLSMAIWSVVLLIGLPIAYNSFSNLINCKLHEYSIQVYSNWNVLIRYISYPFLISVLYCMWQYTKQTYFNKTIINVLKSVIAIYLLLLLSMELSCLVEMSQNNDNFDSTTILRRFGYTLLWGVYSLLLIVYGIKTKSKIVRITAISIFAITLLKLFVIDIQTLSKGFKIVAFLALGALLLTVSFLYQKFAKIIFSDDEDQVLIENKETNEKE